MSAFLSVLTVLEAKKLPTLELLAKAFNLGIGFVDDLVDLEIEMSVLVR